MVIAQYSTPSFQLTGNYITSILIVLYLSNLIHVALQSVLSCRCRGQTVCVCEVRGALPHCAEGVRGRYGMLPSVITGCFTPSLSLIQWRNGWFMDFTLESLSRLRPDPSPLHTELIMAAEGNLFFQAKKAFAARKDAAAKINEKVGPT